MTFVQSSRIWHRGRYLVRRAAPSPKAMSLFGPISRPLLNEATTPIIRRALQRARNGRQLRFRSGDGAIGRFRQRHSPRPLARPKRIRLFHDRQHDAGHHQRARRYGHQHRPRFHRGPRLAGSPSFRTAHHHGAAFSAQTWPPGDPCRHPNPLLAAHAKRGVSHLCGRPGRSHSARADGAVFPRRPGRGPATCVPMSRGFRRSISRARSPG